MRLELLRLENLIEREIALRKIRNLDSEDESTENENYKKRSILLKKFRETAKRKMEETNIFLNALGKQGWIKGTEIINGAKKQINRNVSIK